MFVWEKRSEYKTPTAWNSNGIPCRGQWFQTINVLFRASFALLQILLGGGEHEFDSVELVDFAGTGIVVDGYDVGGRIFIKNSHLTFSLFWLMIKDKNTKEILDYEIFF